MYYFQSPQSNILTIDWIVLLFMLNEIQIVLLIIQLCFRKYYVNRGSGRRTRRTRHHRWWYISFSTSRPLNKIEMNEWHNQTRYNICDHWALTHAQLRYPFRRRGRRRPYQLPLRLIKKKITMVSTHVITDPLQSITFTFFLPSSLSFWLWLFVFQLHTRLNKINSHD